MSLPRWRPSRAFDGALLWDFIGIADAVMQRIGDGIGKVEDLFGAANSRPRSFIAAPPRPHCKQRRDLPATMTGAPMPNVAISPFAWRCSPIWSHAPLPIAA